MRVIVKQNSSVVGVKQSGRGKQEASESRRIRGSHVRLELVQCSKQGLASTHEHNRSITEVREWRNEFFVRCQGRKTRF